MLLASHSNDHRPLILPIDIAITHSHCYYPQPFLLPIAISFTQRFCYYPQHLLFTMEISITFSQLYYPQSFALPIAMLLTIVIAIAQNCYGYLLPLLLAIASNYLLAKTIANTISRTCFHCISTCESDRKIYIVASPSFSISPYEWSCKKNKQRLCKLGPGTVF